MKQDRKFFPSVCTTMHVRVNFGIKKYILALLFVGGAYYANAQELWITLNEKDISIEDCFIKLKAKSNYDFVYNPAVIQSFRINNIVLKNNTIEEAMQKILSGLPLSFTIIDKTVIVRSRRTMHENRELQGVIVDDNGRVASGVTIVVKNTKNATLTNERGIFFLKNVNPGNVLVITGSNIEMIELGVPTYANFLSVQVKYNIQQLEEQVIVGYGKVSKQNNTGSVASIKSDAIANQPISDFLYSLTGRLAGVSVQNTQGAIGSLPNIQIRGQNAFGAGINPLYVIDGIIIVDGAEIGVGEYVDSSSPFTLLNPADIERIDVLKDADATAIYGSRGTNGVILITTKKGRVGALQAKADLSYSSGNPTYINKKLNTTEYLQLRKEAFAADAVSPTDENAPDLVKWDPNAYTNWTNYEFQNPAPTFKTTANLSGGTPLFSYYFSGGYNKSKDITMGNPTFERYTTNLNIQNQLADDRIKTSLQFNYGKEDFSGLKGIFLSQISSNSIQRLPPNFPLYDQNKNLYWGDNKSTYYNPQALLGSKSVKGTESNLLAAMITVRFIDPLQFKILGSYSSRNFELNETIPQSAINPLNPAVKANMSFTSDKTGIINIEPQFNCVTSIGKGKLEAVAGSTYANTKNVIKMVAFKDFPSDLFMDNWSAAGNSVYTKGSSEFNEKFFSIFGRINYNFDKTYILNLSYRRDNSSKFGPKYRWGDFGALGAAWIFSNENFTKNVLPILSYGKLRASYGITGNDKISNYLYRELYFLNENNSYAGNPAVQSTYWRNESIHWEKTSKLETALELGLFKNKLHVTVAHFYNRTTDLLVKTSLPSQTGYPYQWSNFPGIVENKGWEFEISSQNIQYKEFSWMTSVNLSFVQNRLAKFDGLDQSPYRYEKEIGKPIDVIRGWNVEGINPATGLPVFTDVNKNNIPHEQYLDYQSIGSTSPIIFGGINNNIQWKNWNLDFTFNCNKQMATNWKYGTFLDNLPGQNRNVSREVLGNYWQKNGDHTLLPRLVSGASLTMPIPQSIINYYSNNSSAVYRQVFYVRLNNVALNYSFPPELLRRFKINGLKIYAQGSNLYFWSTKNLGKDPEQKSIYGSPLLRTTSFGIQIIL